MAAIAFWGCNSADNSANQQASVTVKLDYSRLMPGGQTCEDGRARPCFAPLHSAPNYTDQSLTKTVKGKDGLLHADWPPEPTALKVDCQVKGAPVKNAQGEISDIWDVFEAPVEYVDPAALAEVQAGKIRVGTVSDAAGKITTLLVFTPDMWAGNHGVYAQLNACTAAQNPGGYPAAA